MHSSSPLPSLVALLVVGAPWLFGCADNTTPRAAAASKPANVDGDAIRLMDLDGNPQTLSRALNGAITVAIFTRTDCPVSNRYAPEVRQLYDDFHDKHVEFVLVYVDPREQPAAIRAHLREYEYPCSALRDPEHALAAATGATITPEAVVFDADGKITYRGRIDDRNADFGQTRHAPVKRDLADAIDATLAGRPVAEPVTKAVGCYIADLK